jgi:tRNA pseudouridine38-40 synthase
MTRYAALVEYDGAPYKGFQAQNGLKTVQGALESAIFQFCGQTLRVTAAGRTDTGVHAKGQVISFDLDHDFPADTVSNALNAYLRQESVVLLNTQRVEPLFSARFSATGRLYRYRLLVRPAPPALERGQVWHIKQDLNLEAMQEASLHLIGTHDFTTFRDGACQAKSPIKTLDAIKISAAGNEIWLDFGARSFLHRQVRSMTGTLVQVGLGRWMPFDVKAALLMANRSACGQVAPATGLNLMGVCYHQGPDFQSIIQKGLGSYLPDINPWLIKPSS